MRSTRPASTHFVSRTRRGSSSVHCLSKKLPSVRWLGVLLIAGFAVPASAQIQISEVILEDAPFAYWRLDETDVTVAALNNSGTQNVPANFVGDTDGGDITLGEPGLADPDNAAVRFEGFSGYIQIPDSALINNGGPYLERTVELWFSAEDAFTPTEMVLFEEGGVTRGSNIYIRDGSVFVGAWNRADDDARSIKPLDQR